jgi:hypothetical protein
MENPVTSSLIDSPLDPFKETDDNQDDDMDEPEHQIVNNFPEPNRQQQDFVELEAGE